HSYSQSGSGVNARISVDDSKVPEVSATSNSASKPDGGYAVGNAVAAATTGDGGQATGSAFGLHESPYSPALGTVSASTNNPKGQAQSARPTRCRSAAGPTSPRHPPRFRVRPFVAPVQLLRGRHGWLDDLRAGPQQEGPGLRLGAVAVVGGEGRG